MSASFQNPDLVFQKAGYSQSTHIIGWPKVVADKLSRLGQNSQSGLFLQRSCSQYVPGDTNLRWTYLLQGSTTNWHHHKAHIQLSAVSVEGRKLQPNTIET